MIIGPGDIFIAGALGACFGWKYILLIIAGAVALQVLAYIPVFIQKLMQKKDYITIIEFILFMLIALGNYLYLKYINTDLFVVNITFSIVLLISGLILCKRVIDTLPKNLIELNEAMLNGEELEEESKNELSHMPFGPALCCAAILFIFLH